MVDAADTPVIYLMSDPEDPPGAIADLERIGWTVRTFDCPEALRSALPLPRPGCLLIDGRTATRSGSTLQEFIRGQHFQLPVIVLTDEASVPTVVDVMKAGAFDLLECPLQDGQLERCVLRAIEMDREAQRSEARRTEARARLASLTRREREVLRMVVNGKPSGDIAQALGISPRTVEAHRSRVLQKLNVRSVAELVRIALLAES